MRRKIAHIICPFKGKEGGENSIIQPITFESMRRAKERADGKVDVELVSTQFVEDRSVVPDYFSITPDLQRSVLDAGNYPGNRKLPMLKDILDKLYEHSDAEYFVFTNGDIGLMPQFYLAINDIIDNGLDGFIINRRRMSSRFNSVDQLDEIYSEAGDMHNGYDCFVFKRAHYEKFNLGEVCVGIFHIGNTLAHNLYCWSDHFRLYTNKHLTFHIGMDLVKKVYDKDLVKHNYRSYREVLKDLEPNLRIENIPGAGLPFFKRHLKWLMNPTMHYPTLLKLDIKERKTPRKKVVKEDSGQRYFEWLQKMVKLEE